MATVKLVTFGQGGDTVHYGRGHTCSGYGSPERPHAALGEEIPDGTPVIDKRAAVGTPDGFSWVFRGPMVNVDLPDGEREDCPTPSPTLAAGLEGGYAVMLARQTVARAASSAPGPLDYVSIAEYVRGWREHGARIGEYRGGKIVWESDLTPSGS